MRIAWRAGIQSRTFVPLVAVTLAIGVLPQFLTFASPDVAWLLYLAGRLLDGQRLYVDLIEVNPPLIVWLNLPPVILARWSGLPDVVVYRGLVVLAAVTSILLCRAILTRMRDPSDPAVRRIVLTLLAVALLALPQADFGEREHLMLILAAPYLFLIGLRLEGEPIEPWLGVLVGLLAGAGIALKPYFALLLLAVELRLLAARPGHLLRPETGAILAVAAVYLAAVQLWAAPYWELTRSVGMAYYGFLREPMLLTALTGEGAGLPLFAVLAFVALRDPERERILTSVLLVAIVALYLSAVLQGKGWRYHFYPSMALSLVLLGLLVLGERAALRSVSGRVYAAVAAAVIVYLPLSLVGSSVLQLADPGSVEPVGDPDLPRLAELVRREAPDGSLLVLSTNMASAFPLVPLSGARWTSRFPSVWLLGAVYGRELESSAPLRYRPPDGQPALERYLNRAVVGDLVRHQPDLLVVLRPAPDRWEWGVRRLDYLSYFSADSAFARELTHYGFLADLGEYRIYKRSSEGAVAAAEPTPLPLAHQPPPPAVAAGVHIAPMDARTAIEVVLFLGLVALAYRRRELHPTVTARADER